MSESAPSYPPSRHLLRDLGVVIERDSSASLEGGQSGVTGSLEVVPAMLDAVGRVRVGVLATLVDVVAGETAIRAVSPDWIATSSLEVGVAALPATGWIEARPRVLRKSRQTVVLEAKLTSRSEQGKDEPIGLATLGFAILPARSAIQKSAHWAETPDSRSEFGLADSGLRAPILDAIGIQTDPARPDQARLALDPYLVNSLGALQGGGMAILLEATADRLAEVLLGRRVRVRSLTIHYLKLARRGPVRAEARPIALSQTGGALLRVELYDEGRDGGEEELLSVASVQVEAADAEHDAATRSSPLPASSTRRSK